MSLKAYYPTRQEIQDAMKGAFDVTWTESKQDPGKKEYGYYVYLKDSKLEKGNLSKGDPRDCSATEQHVTLVGSESPLMDNPTSEAYKGNQYVVAWFHTHPTRYGCGSSYGTRDPGPSTDDENEISAQSPQVPAFVYDYTSFVDNDLPINSGAKVYPYGSPRRIPYPTSN